MNNTFKLSIDCENSAFACLDGPVTQESAAVELARILREISGQLESGRPYGKYQNIYALNGNNVGQFALKTEQG